MDDALPGDRPEFILLTGPLGSGKTTLLSDHLSNVDSSDTGVLVNDAGEINIDGAVIGSDHRNLALATLDDGCICCSLGNDLQDGIDAVLLARAEQGKGPPRRIILETSGLAEPAPIIRSLRSIRQVMFDVRVITTFDASALCIGDSFLPHYASQLAAAQTIVLTKLDRVAELDWPDRAAAAQRFNPTAAAVVTGQPKERSIVAFASDNDFRVSRPSAFSASAGSTTRIIVASVAWADTASWSVISEWIENFAGFFGNRLLRLKGFVQPSGQDGPLLIDGVGDVFSPPRRIKLQTGVRLGLMAVLRDVSRHELRQTFCSESSPELTVG